MMTTNSRTKLLRIAVAGIAALGVLQVPAAPATAASADCADPMVLVFDGSINKLAGVVLTESAAGVVIDWGGSGTTSQVQTYGVSPGLVKFNYDTATDHTVKICGNVTAFGMPSGNRSQYLSALTKVESFGSLGTASLAGAFAWTNVTSVPTSLPSGVTDLSEMFASASQFNQPLESWDISNVTNLAGMFDYATKFNQPLAAWNTSNVTDMSRMFASASTFNQAIGNWNTSSVTNMDRMFDGASEFNQPLAAWDTSDVTNMDRMFADGASDDHHGDGNMGASRFDQPIGSWNTGNVVSMVNMFRGADKFNQPIGDWDTSSVTDMSYLFEYASAFNQPIGDWDTSNVTDLSGVFSRATSFNQPIGDWDTSNVTWLGSMFADATKFNQPIGTWNTSNVTDMGSMFYKAKSFNQPIGTWNTSNVEYMSSMFDGASAFNQPLGDWKITSLTVAGDMLNDTNLSVANYDSLLNGWANQTVHRNVTLGAYTANYSKAAKAARSKLISKYGWTILDGGLKGSHKISPAPTPTIEISNTGAYHDGVAVLDTLRASATWGPKGVKLSYQWYRKSASGKVKKIAGATKAKYTVATANLTHRIRVKVTGRLSGYQSVSKTSAWTTKVAKGQFACYAPTIGKVVKVGTAVKATVYPWSPTPKLSYQWLLVDTNGKSTKIKNATKTSYTPKEADLGSKLKVRVTGQRTGFERCTKTSPAVEVTAAS